MSISEMPSVGARVASALTNAAARAEPLAAATAAPAQRTRVLIYSADIGGGHDAMANAIRGELLTRYAGQVDVEVANGLKVSSPLTHRLMRDGYAAQLKYAPGSYGAMYELATKPAMVRLNGYLNNALTGSRLLDDIAERRPDVVVSTFPNVTGTLGHLRDTGKLRVPAIGTIIDSDPHAMWTAPGIDAHAVLNPADLPRIARFGTAERPIHGRAIRPPVDPRSFERYDVAAARAAFCLPRDQRVLLVSGGSWGLAMPEAELRHILAETDLHLAIATGRNEQAFSHLQRTFPADRVTPIPFTREMPKLLAASDGVLTNSAGMTTMESFARGRPVVLYRPLPGHGIDGAVALDADHLATHAASPDAAIDALRRIEHGGDPELAQRTANAHALFQQPHVSDLVMDAARSRTMAHVPAES